MTKVDWRTLDLDKCILREPTPDESRIILWLPGQLANGFQHWERVTNVPGVEIAQEQDICFTQAASMPLRQKVRGLLGKLVAWLSKPTENPTWLVPTGGWAEQAGERQTGLLLAWADEESGARGEEQIKARWSEKAQLRKVGRNFFVVSQSQAGQVPGDAAAALLGNPREQAEELLAAARQSGDRRAEASALTDLGIAFLRGGDGQRGMVILEEPATLARQLEDRSGENDAQCNLAMALLAAGQLGRAQDVLGQALAYARETGNRSEEKIILANLAAVLASTRDFAEALVALSHALAVARELGDRHHEADLLWLQAIVHAELGRQDEASTLAQAAIDIHATLRSPHVGWLTSHLKKFRPIPSRAQPGPTAVGVPPGGYYTGPAPALAPLYAGSASDSDPGVLRSAMNAVKTMENSAGSGIKMVPAATHQERLEICTACPHHTGVRCKLCGHFTSSKAWLPYETCPIGKWAR